ncbi:MAG: glycosyltransferase family protein [Nitrospinae bacterium]|nr:glycosyltransferase family protein [Nitrospinota bacterium]
MGGVTAIVQARVASTRLRRKILEPVGDKPLILWVTSRLRAAALVDDVVIATSLSPADDEVFELARREGILCHRGSEDDVLDRFIGAAKLCPADTIIRATGDNPLLDSVTLDLMIKSHLDSGSDYTGANGVVPLGSTAEVVALHALKSAWEEARETPYREHVTPFIHSQPGRFKVRAANPAEYLAGKNYRLTVDTNEDLALMRVLCAELGKAGKPFDAHGAVELLDRRPELVSINMEVLQKDWRRELSGGGTSGG